MITVKVSNIKTIITRGGQTETDMNISVGKFGRESDLGKKKKTGVENGAFKLLPLQFRRWEWVYWIMDLFIGLEKKEEQQSWYQSGLKPLDLWGFSKVAGGLFESAIYQLRPNQNQAFRGLVLSHAKCYIRIQSTWLVKAWLIKKPAAHLFANICDEKRLQDEDLESHMQPPLGLLGDLKVPSKDSNTHWRGGCIRGNWSIC